MSDEEKYDGGPAFPSKTTLYAEMQGGRILGDTICFQGMTLRQYYAAEALKAMGDLPWLYQYTDCSGEREKVDKQNKRIADQAAESANIYADAMIRAGDDNDE